MKTIDRETEIMNRLEREEFTPREQKIWDSYHELCTSACGNDYDCPHEEDAIGQMMEEAIASNN